MRCTPLPVVIIGGGIAGLVAASERHGVAAEVYEAGPRLAGMASSHTDPDGFSYGAQPGDDVWSSTDEAIIEHCVSTLDPLVPGIRSKVIGASVLRQPLGYPVFALEYEPDRAALSEEGTGVGGFYSVGRNGEYDHILMEDIFWRLRRRMPAIVRART